MTLSVKLKNLSAPGCLPCAWLTSLGLERGEGQPPADVATTAGTSDAAEQQRPEDNDADEQEGKAADDGYPQMTEKQKKLFELRLKMKWLNDRKKKIGKLLDSNGLDMSKAHMLDRRGDGRGQSTRNGRRYLLHMGGMVSNVLEENIDKMVKELKGAGRSGNHSAGRKFNEDKDIDSINDGMSTSTRRLKRLWQVHAEIKNNLEELPHFAFPFCIRPARPPACAVEADLDDDLLQFRPADLLLPGQAMSKTESRKLSDDYEVVDVLGRRVLDSEEGVSKSEGKTQVAIKTLRRLGPAMNGIQQGSKVAFRCGSRCPPFHAPTNREKQQRILQGEFSFQDHAWKTISSSAKELISRLLSVEPYKRPTASDVCPMLLLFFFHPYCHIGQSELHITVLIKVVDLVLHHLDQLLGHPWVIGDWAKQDLMDAEVISKLKRFNARRKLRAAAIASVLSSKHSYLAVRWVGVRLCADGENATLAEFEQVLKAMKLESLVPLAPRVFDLFDNNRDGTVDMREILCGLSSLRNSRGDDALRLCFQMYDADRSGCISKDELASMLRALPEECLPGDITEPGKLDEVFDEMDANGDGKVSFDEFKAAMQKDSALQDVVLSSLRTPAPGQ
ncbi:unnamed protein product [Miscanthus lutarioriparius]|uniref:EF-hand domain-containing protein n=1 Tax=Miscanthus lutarioriparius TaxID=422564 RepID=A0A811SCQ5_9POAL|nr:unnamed protein product [Miscanthus lutarioriparius]